MAGIVSYGVYVPIYRLSREIINQTWGRGGKGEKAVANADEDSLTLGVEAARSCLKSADKEIIDALYFASTTPPYKEKQSASIIAAAVDLREDIMTVDLADSLRSGTTAIKIATDMVKGGSARNVLVVISDCRMPYPNSEMEASFGDGAAAFLIGEDEAVKCKGSYFLTSEFMDIWRQENDKYIRTWEDRFVREVGYMPYLSKAVSALLENNGTVVKDISKVVFNAPDSRQHKAMAATLKLDAKTQVQDPLFDKVGNTGVAFAPMMLAGALDEAKPGDIILLANYGDGADAHILHVTDNINKIENRNRLKKLVESKLNLDNYGKYIKFRNLMELTPTLDYTQRTSLPQIWRDRRWVYRMHGHKCQKCGHVQFPMQKFCMYCQAPEEFLWEIPLSDKKGTLFTYSIDERALTLDPPNVLAIMSFEGGGRFYGSMTDRDANNLRVGMPMELTFRRLFDALGIHNYFWKCKPTR